jgi:hypothetical protein
MDLFEQLKRIDNQEIKLANDPEFMDSFSPFMINKWYSYTTDAKRVLLVNELLNPMIFALHKEQKLLFYLACCCSDGTQKRYSWIKRPKKFNKDLISMVSEYYNITAGDAERALEELEKEDLHEILEQMGYEDKLKNKIKKAI